MSVLDIVVTVQDVFKSYITVLFSQLGFFKRKKHSELKQFKDQKSIKRRSQMRMSRVSEIKNYNALQDDITTPVDKEI